jgi:hypothetical protein
VNGRRSAYNAEAFVHRCRHATWQHAVGVRLSKRRRHDGRCEDIRLRRCRNRGLRARGGRRHIAAHRTRRGLGRGSERAAQQQLLPPGVELPTADPVPGRHHRRRRTRLQAFGHDLALLLGRPATPGLAAGGHLQTPIASARMTSRKSVPCVRSLLSHHVALRHGRHLARNAPRRSTWRRRPAYDGAACPGSSSPMSSTLSSMT